MSITQPGIDINPNTRSLLDRYEKDSERVDLLLEFSEYKKKAQLYEKRRKIIESIPKFWPTALKNNDSISSELEHEDDLKALDSLTDIWVLRDQSEPRVYTIEFTFGKNPYFEDKVLKKVFKYLEPKVRREKKADAEGFKWEMLDFDWERDVKPQVTKIQWKNGKNLCRKYPRVGDTDCPDELGSFFNWFELPCDAFDIGVTIAEDIFPDAIPYFLNEMEDDFEDDDDDDDDDDDAGDDDDDSD